MPENIEEKIKSLGLILPEPAVPIASYVPYCITGRLVFISGQLPVLNGAAKFVGKVGKQVSLEEASVAAKICALNMIAHLKTACNGYFSSKNGLNNVTRVVKIEGFINSMPGFKDHPKILNGASDLMVSIFGDKKGSHTRIAVGVSSLPLDVPVEVAGIFEIDT